MKKGVVLIGLSTVAVTADALADNTVKTKSQKPNILFIFSDDHALKAISAYGDSLNSTPNIDKIAKDGAIFRNNFCANSICAPSRACILTGKHSHANGHKTNRHTFNGRQQTFPKLLQNNGYKTALIGKWHLKSNPTGFDHWMVYPHQGHYYNPIYKVPTKNGKTKTVKKMGYSVELTTDLSMEWMKEAKKSDQPFLMMCQFKAPHRSWAPAPKYFDLYEDTKFPIPETFYDDFKNRTTAAAKHSQGIVGHMTLGDDLKVQPDSDKLVREVSRMTPEQKKLWDDAFTTRNEKFVKAGLKGKELAEWKFQRYMQNYLRCVAAVDDNVGRLLDFLEKEGLAENTIVVYSSDQGFYLGEHGWFDKRWMYEESFRMPLVMKWPGVIKPETKVEELTQNIDFASTFLEATGVEIPKDIQGESLLPLLKGNNAGWRDALYYHYYETTSGHKVPAHYGVRTARYKLIRYYQINEWELFDLQEDPNELKSVYDDAEYSSIREELNNKLTELRKQYNFK